MRMKFRIEITPEGEVTFFTENGTYDAGKVSVEAIKALLNGEIAGLNMVLGETEQHRHDDPSEHNHVLADGTTHAHSH